MVKKYVVDLTSSEREELIALTKSGEISARKLKRANLLLLADTDVRAKDMAVTLNAGIRTVERPRKRFVLEGLQASLNERPRPGAQCKLDAKGEAVLATLAQSRPPEGRQRWTLQLLTDRLVELKVVESISDETVRRVIKNKDLSYR